MYHYPETEAEGAPKKANLLIKDAFSMKKQGFKWKTLINDPTSGARYQVMQMSRPKDLQVSQEAAQRRKMKAKQEPLAVKAAMLMKIDASATAD